ncbi:MAG: alpha/beta hydrolase [Pseudomonadota bacterium]
MAFHVIFVGMNDAPFKLLFDKLGLNPPDFTLKDFSGLTLAQTAARLRESFYRATRAIEPDPPELADISTIAVDGADGALPARLYTPNGVGLGLSPGLVFFHGGGFVLGDLDSHDMLCRRLAEASRCRVLSVGYRLAPEHKFPTAHFDAEAAWKWAVRSAETLMMDPDRMAVGGDSAGGNLAAFLAQEMNRTDGPAPAFQLLLYPLLQFADIRAKKMRFQESGFFISPNMFDYFRDAYLAQAADRMDPRVSPLFAPDEDFKGLPPAHFVLCGWDPLRDEGRAYADKMAHWGAPVTVREHAGMVHGFMNLTAASVAARDGVAAAGHVLGRALGAIAAEA